MKRRDQVNANKNPVQWRRFAVVLMILWIWSGSVENAPAGTITVTASNVIATPDVGEASLYPSFIGLNNYKGRITAVRVTLNDIQHSFPADYDILLVGPGGQKVILMSDCGGGFGLINTTITFADSGPPLPIDSQISSGTYRPSNYPTGSDPLDTFPPDPAQAYSTSFAVFNNTSPNGVWNLYVVDDSSGDFGTIHGGWTLELDTTLFQNLGTIQIPDAATSNPYPGVIPVAGLPPNIANLRITLRQLSYSHPDNLDILLSGPQPGGQTAVIMSDAGGNSSLAGVTLTFDDTAVDYLPDDTQIVEGTYRPTNIGPDDDLWPAPAPPPLGSLLSVFNGIDPTGDWKLYIANDATGASGSLNGWILEFGLEPTILANISTRLRVETGEDVLIGGFIVSGTQPKQVLLRAIGPSLSIADHLADPVLELRDASGKLLASNDNWRTDQEKEIIATSIPPTNDLESAIVTTLPANNSAYTAIVRGANNTTGIGLVEVYDLDHAADSTLANISTRGLVQSGDNALIAGTILLGALSQKVMVRAIGPSLDVANPLGDPTVELRDANAAVIASNDNWRENNEAEILATTIPPATDLESAIVTTLPAAGASYTAVVRGVDDTSGLAVVEIYALNQ